MSDSEDVSGFPLPHLATTIVFSVAVPGFLINLFLFYKFFKKRGFLSGFQKLCLIKTVPNIIVTSSFLFWVVPLSLFPNQPVARLPNVIIGQVAGAGAYILGPQIQVFMAANRFLALYFPLKQMKIDKSQLTNAAIVLAVLVSFVYTALGFPDECGYIYDTVTFTWNPEPFPCAELQLDILMYSVYFLALVSNSLGIVTAMKLICFSGIGSGISRADATRRRRKRVLMFVQSALQDCLHVVDLINCTYIYTLSDDLWFQFVFLTLSFVLIYTLDGVVMFYFHPELHPKCLRSTRIDNQAKSPILFTAASTVSLV